MQAVDTGTPPTYRIRTQLERHHRVLRPMLDAPTRAGVALAQRRSALMDELLGALCPEAFRPVGRDASPCPSLGAVGGYGRRVLGLGSDVDVHFLVEDDPESAATFVDALLYPLWDAGVRIGHQVMTVDDAVALAEEDLPTATALLDWRHIAGDPRIGHRLQERAFETIFEPEGGLATFLGRLEEGVHRRHERFGGSVYLLEPDVKSGAGGLRDLDVVLWAGRAGFGTRGIDGLADAGVLLPAEASALRDAADFLWSVRNHLHDEARRQSDRLGFDQQERVASRLGYRDRIGAAPTASATQVAGAMAEAFMSDYYRHARVVARSVGQMLTRARPRRSVLPPMAQPLGVGLCESDGAAALAEDLDLAVDPAAALRLYAVAVDLGMRVAPETRDRILRAGASDAFGEALRASPEAASAFVQLACTARESRFKNGSILGELHDVGLLTAMIPEFLPVVGRVHHDVYHVYTVDVHSLAAVDRLRSLVRGDLSRKSPLACRLAAEVARPQVLYMATLLHDVGKALGGKDHAERGAKMAVAILGRLGFDEEDIDEVAHLISEHLGMYLVAVRRDFHQTATLAEFLDSVHGLEGLRELYLLTIADVSTTSPTAMTRWKAGMLEELYLTAEAALSGERAHPDARLARVRRHARASWPDDDKTLIDEFLDSMPERYLLSHAPTEIVAHARLASAPPAAPVTAALIPSKDPEVAELCVVAMGQTEDARLCVVTRDRPGLLASITAVLSGKGLEVHAAQVHTRKLRNGGTQALDLFWVRQRADDRQTLERLMPCLREDLCRVVSGEIDADDLVVQRSGHRWAERPTPQVPSEVVIDDRASSEHTIIEVLTKDRPGILFQLAQTLHNVDLVISVAKINTEGTRVADVFYVTEQDGSKVTGEQRIGEIRQRLHDTLAATGASPPTLDGEVATRAHAS